MERRKLGYGKSSWQEIDLFKGLVICCWLHHRDGRGRIKDIQSVAIITTWAHSG